MSEIFTDRINRHVRGLLRNYRPTATQGKTIHDPIWGSVAFRPWEVRIIDSPLFQRLRSVNQLGLAETTYPAARHTRFEHSLGVAAVASRMMEQLRVGSEGRDDVDGIVGDAQIRLIRLAALLHDVGHCPYSHLSEAVYGRMPEFLAAREELLAELKQPVHPKPHEIFSYMIITSEAFTDFFFESVNYPDAADREQAKRILRAAGKIIIGAVNEDRDGTRYSYLTSVINGNFDADKLDYTQRDSYTAGIALTYGAERFLTKLILCRDERNGRADYRLALPAEALSTVEELLFNRSMLYHYMYNHQKVLAAESQMRDALYALVMTGQVNHPCDFLSLNNAELAGLYHTDQRPYEEFGAQLTRTMDTIFRELSDRELMKRALELTPDSFAEYGLKERKIARTLDRIRMGDEEDALQYMVDTWERETLYPKGIAEYIRYLGACSTEGYIAERRRVAERIAAACREQGISADFDAFDLAIAFLPPQKTDLDLTVADRHGRIVDLSDAIQRIRKWNEALNQSKWRGYLFVSSRIDRKIAGRVFREYLEEKIRDAEI